MTPGIDLSLRIRLRKLLACVCVLHIAYGHVDGVEALHRSRLG